MEHEGIRFSWRSSCVGSGCQSDTSQDMGKTAMYRKFAQLPKETKQELHGGARLCLLVGAALLL
eukprot:6175371-Amphidinium_carterae.1